MKKQYKRMMSLLLALTMIVSMMSITAFAKADGGRNGDLVVMLDPGHGGNDSGAVGVNGLKEKDLNLKIAQYCKEELEKYSGVKVYMTRYGDNNTGNDSASALLNRVEDAKNKGADIYIALHVNDAETTTARGVEIYYPNTGYRPEFNTIGKGVAQQMQNRLVELGLRDRKIQTRDVSKDTYPDGSREDYYSVIRNSKYSGFPALLVEHGFIQNADDVNDFLSSDAKLQALGVADATGIATHYGLTKGEQVKPQLEVYKNSFAGKFKIKANEFGTNAQVAIWSHDDGQDDIKWYSLNVGENNIEIDVKDHKNSFGLYAIRVYSGGQCLASEDVMINRKPLSRATIQDTNGKETVYKATAEILSNPSEVSGVRFGVWSDKNGQDDIVWYDGTKSAAGVWTANVDINNHKTEGYYYVHAYANVPNFDPEFIGRSEINITQPKTNELTINNYNKEAGTFDVIVDGIVAPAGVSRVRVPVWCSSDQSDLVWYDATKQNDGSYKVTVNIANHKYSTGLYTIHMYLYANNGVVTTKAGSQNVELPDAGIIARDTNGKETTYELKATNAVTFGNLQSVRFAVWSDKGGQDDIVWYWATKDANGVWTADANINNHKTEGTYSVHTYAILENGNDKFIGSTSFTVTQPKTNELTIDNYSKEGGTFDIIVDGLVAPAGVSSVRLPVWCSPDQSDIVWYWAAKQNDGSYKATVRIANHNYLTGLYTIHMYLYANNGVVTTKTGSRNVELPDAGIIAQDTNGKETTYQLQATHPVVFGNMQSVRYAVWSDQNGQDDLVWYEATNPNEMWTATVNTNNHKRESVNDGVYIVDTYATLANGKTAYIGGTSFTVTQPKTNELTINNYNKEAGTFDVIVDGIVAPAGVSRVRVPVWCSSDQSDIVWYDATKQNDGSYKVTVNIANHKYSTGLYTIHMYLYANNGVVTTKAGSQNVELPEIGVSAQDTNGKETTYELKAINAETVANLQSVRFAVWSEKGEQKDSIVWYDGVKGANGTWTATANINNHRTTEGGAYIVHAYVIVPGKEPTFIGSTNFTVTQPKTNELTINNYNKDAGTFDVIVDGIVATAGVSRVRFPVWCSPNQSDIVWYDATKQNDGSYKATVNIANHKYAIGLYTIHMYLYANNGVVTTKAGSQNVELPEAGIIAHDTNGKETTYELSAINAEKTGNAQSVRFGVWSDKAGQEKSMVWYYGTKGDNGVWTATANINKHKTEGYYYVHTYAILQNGKDQFIGSTSFTVGEISANASVENVNATTGQFNIVISDIKSASGVDHIKVPVWSIDDHSDIYWYYANRQSNGTYLVEVDPMNHNYNSGLYVGHVYMTAGNGIEKLVSAVSQPVDATKFYTIMGETTATADQMVKYFQKSGKSYPSAVLATGGAPDIATFCRLFVEEANAEGVRAEVAFAQTMKETGWLQFGGIVKVEQFNFAGIGAIDGNAQGNCASFPDVRTGIRAQIQHLKAYGSKEALVNTCVDPRFHLVPREGSIFVQWLGISDNPKGYGWATGKGYGFDIVKMIKDLKAL